jgi:hypothetical protein
MNKKDAGGQEMNEIRSMAATLIRSTGQVCLWADAIPSEYWPESMQLPDKVKILP